VGVYGTGILGIGQGAVKAKNRLSLRLGFVGFLKNKLEPEVKPLIRAIYIISASKITLRCLKY